MVVTIIITRNNTLGMVIDTLKAGKYVYSAVPETTSVKEIIEIEQLVRETKLTCLMGETGYYRVPKITDTAVFRLRF